MNTVKCLGRGTKPVYKTRTSLQTLIHAPVRSGPVPLVTGAEEYMGSVRDQPQFGRRRRGSSRPKSRLKKRRGAHDDATKELPDGRDRRHRGGVSKLGGIASAPSRMDGPSNQPRPAKIPRRDDPPPPRAGEDAGADAGGPYSSDDDAQKEDAVLARLGGRA